MQSMWGEEEREDVFVAEGLIAQGIIAQKKNWRVIILAEDEELRDLMAEKSNEVGEYFERNLEEDFDHEFHCVSFL